MARKIFISAGETSGDIHGANLIREIKEINPHLKIEGFGGERMISQGLASFFPLAELSVMWFLQVLLKAPVFLRLLRRVDDHFRTDPPALCVLIDYPGFHFRIAEKAKKYGIPVLYYISPQVWAWHQSRVKKMKRIIDHMLVILPFEEKFFQDAGIPVTYVGHPLCDNMAQFKPDPAFRDSVLKGGTGPLVAMLPGSRKQEIKHILPLMLGAAKRLRESFAGIRFVLSAAEPSLIPLLERMITASGVAVTIFSDKTYDIMGSADLALTASGTASLELAYFHTPMVILYKTIPPSWILCKLLMKTKFIGMVNILGDREVVPEVFPFVGGGDTVAEKAKRLISDARERERVIADLKAITARLSRPGTSRRVAEKVLSFLPAGS